jgi:hypothetical protein
MCVRTDFERGFMYVENWARAIDSLVVLVRVVVLSREKRGEERPLLAFKTTTSTS